VDEPAIWPALVFVAGVLAVVAGQIGVSYFLGERHHERATDEVYESGLPVTGSSRIRFPAHFYLIAMFFVIFDLEAAFLLAWAVAVPELGWAGYAEVVVFVAVLIVAWAYLLRVGALDWGPIPRHQRPPEAGGSAAS